MGCLPIIILFVLGTGLGWWLDGSTGAVWGAGIGIALGIVSGLILVAVLHRARTDSNIDH
ncbi:MAG TPA: hypothetical protein VFJ01_11745 [Oleiagrimonas sp.]|nr:hypothetical protein [Oleiagrimonas sp.]HET6587278.1 hypothetical protein [Oleiagrimonas sp.]HET7301310.1 hypothetical protein [Oleiagrimonas sp.]